jgi:hypothetical protein
VRQRYPSGSRSGHQGQSVGYVQRCDPYSVGVHAFIGGQLISEFGL